DRLHPALPQRVVDGAGDEVVREVVEDLALVALLDDARRRLARTEARHARLLRVVARNPIDTLVDDVGGDFDLQALLGLVDVCELCFHVRNLPSISQEGVRKGGVEPPKPFGYRILSPARLPVPPLSRGRGASGRMLADIRDQVLRDR